MSQFCGGESVHGVMGCWIDPSWWTIKLFLVTASQCSTTGVKKGHCMLYRVCGMVHIKEPLLLSGKSSPCGSSRFSLSLSSLSVLLNKTFPSFNMSVCVCVCMSVCMY